jgi:hypothetical protein
VTIDEDPFTGIRTTQTIPLHHDNYPSLPCLFTKSTSHSNPSSPHRPIPTTHIPHRANHIPPRRLSTISITRQHLRIRCTQTRTVPYRRTLPYMQHRRRLISISTRFSLNLALPPHRRTRIPHEIRHCKRTRRLRARRETRKHLRICRTHAHQLIFAGMQVVRISFQTRIHVGLFVATGRLCLCTREKCRVDELKELEPVF